MKFTLNLTGCEGVTRGGFPPLANGVVLQELRHYVVSYLLSQIVKTWT